MSNFDPYDPTANDPKQTTGLGTATAVSLTGTGVTKVVPQVAGTRGVSQFAVSIPIGGSVQVTATAIDDAGVAVPGYSPLPPPPSPLASAAAFAILGASAVTGSAGAGSSISGGNIGIDPNNASSVTNFPPSFLVAPGVYHYADAVALQAQTDLAAALVYFEALPTTLVLTTGDIGSSGTQHSVGAANGTFYAGVYVSPSSIAISTPVTLDAQGNPNAVFVFYATASTITQAVAGTIILANGAQANNVYWVNGSSWTSIGPGTVTIGNILAHTSITLGGGTLNGRALANTGAVTLSTTENITVPTSGGGGTTQPCNAITLAAAPGSSGAYGYNETLPSWYRPNPFGGANVLGAKAYAGFATDMASATVDDDDSNPWTVRGRFPGQVILYFQIPTFENTTGQSLIDTNNVMDETYIDTIDAELIVTVTGGSS